MKNLFVLLFLIFHVEIYAQYTQLGSRLAGSGSIGNSDKSVSVSISADGKTAIVGGPYDNSNIEDVWIYTFNGSSFVQFDSKLFGKGVIHDPGAGQCILVGLSSDGKTALIGGFSDNFTTGVVWIYT